MMEAGADADELFFEFAKGAAAERVPLKLYKEGEYGQHSVYVSPDEGFFVKASSSSDEAAAFARLRGCACVEALQMTEGVLVSRGHSVVAFGLRRAPGEQLNERLAMNHDVRVAVLGAFAEIGRTGVSQLDMKPEHIFVEERAGGGPPRVTVFDFGLAVVRGESCFGDGEFRGNARMASLFQHFGDLANPFADAQALCFLFSSLLCEPRRLPWSGQYDAEHRMRLNVVSSKIRTLFGTRVLEDPWLALARDAVVFSRDYHATPDQELSLLERFFTRAIDVSQSLSSSSSVSTYVPPKATGSTGERHVPPFPAVLSAQKRASEKKSSKSRHSSAKSPPSPAAAASPLPRAKSPSGHKSMVSASSKVLERVLVEQLASLAGVREIRARVIPVHTVNGFVFGKENLQEIDGYAELSQTEAGNLLRHIGNQREPLPALLTPELLLVEAAGIHMPADSISTKSGESRSSQTSASTRPFMGEGIVCGKLEQLHRKVRTRCSTPLPESLLLALLSDASADLAICRMIAVVALGGQTRTTFSSSVLSVFELAHASFPFLTILWALGRFAIYVGDSEDSKMQITNLLVMILCGQNAGFSQLAAEQHQLAAEQHQLAELIQQRLPAPAAASSTSAAPAPALEPAAKSWTIEEVGEWLVSIGLGKLVALFKEQEVDGEVLLILTDNDLFHLKLSLGVTRKLLMAIEKLKNLSTAAQEKR